jgi:Type VI secretion system/phage-baseplate injector OB domain
MTEYIQSGFGFEASGRREETSWARMMTPHAGADRGFLFLPEIGDEVLIAFEDGNPERPIILGSLWNAVDQAPREEFWGEDIAPNEVKREPNSPTSSSARFWLTG